MAKTNVPKLVEFSYIFLLMFCITKTAHGLSCPEVCNPSNCAPVNYCKGGVGKDSCRCCQQCYKIKGEICGGPWDCYGVCDKQLFCKKNFTTGHPFNAKGTCECTEVQCEKSCEHGFVIKNGCQTCECNEYPKCAVASSYNSYHSYYCFTGNTIYCLPNKCNDCCLFHLNCPPNYYYITPKQQCSSKRDSPRKLVTERRSYMDTLIGKRQELSKFIKDSLLKIVQKYNL